jgi:hypothetical protein
MCLGPSASVAVAGAVSITGNLNQTFDGSNNYFLSNQPFGRTYRSYSDLNLNALVATPDTRYSLNSDVSYYKYFGPGAHEQSLSWGTPLSEQLTILHDTYYGKYNFSASWSRSDVETTSLRQTGVAAGRGSIDNYDLNAGFSRELSQLDSFSWSSHASTVSFSDPGSTPYADFSSTASVRHRLTPLTSITQAIYFDWFFDDDVGHTERLLWRPTTSIDSQLTKRLNFNASFGVSFINAYQTTESPSLVSSVFPNPPLGPVFGPGLQQQLGAAHGWDVSAVLSYQVFQDTRAALTVTHGTSPTFDGSLQQIESIAASLDHTINQLSSVSFYAQYSRSASGGPNVDLSSSAATEFLSASANYAYTLARDWRSNVSYTYRQRMDATGSASSSTVLVALAHNFTLYGKPPESVVKTPSELAQESIARAQQVFPFLAPR